MFEFHNIWVLKLNFQLIVVIKTIVYSNIRVILWTWFILMESSWLNFLNKKGWLKYICLFCNQPSQPLKPTPKEKKPFIIYINTYKSDKSTIFLEIFEKIFQSLFCQPYKSKMVLVDGNLGIFICPFDS